ncbi:hypothetical protein [Arthrobacter woluwensis]|uniref:hypothetical protein n=1 Tax=Arthrobacter woluwensis TaxID=156980 RepID=UPI001AAFD51F|nr:hypothetical protein [Arthrobacter woluwensis]QTF73266.1 hypothetical protein G8758_15585 [Arthrobacter woluwensis]
MDQVITASPARARVAVVLVTGAVTTGVVAHAVAALSEPVEWMAWWMGAMAVLCLACALPMAGRRRCAGRAAGHVMAMSAVMVLVHASVVLLPGSGLHHGAGAGSGTGHAAHSGPMLLLIAVELLCMMSASVALRLNRPVRTITCQEYP